MGMVEGSNGTMCPAVCHTMCLANETYCDMGLTEDNCWLGNYCLPEGENCAAPAMRLDCPEIGSRAECDAETEVLCWGGNDATGCALPDYCIPMMVEGANGTMCSAVCHTMCLANETYCDMGLTEDNCWLGNYCLPEGEDCA